MKYIFVASELTELKTIFQLMLRLISLTIYQSNIIKWSYTIFQQLIASDIRRNYSKKSSYTCGYHIVNSVSYIIINHLTYILQHSHIVHNCWYVKNSYYSHTEICYMDWTGLNFYP